MQVDEESRGLVSSSPVATEASEALEPESVIEESAAPLEPESVIEESATPLEPESIIEESAAPMASLISSLRKLQRVSEKTLLPQAHEQVSAKYTVQQPAEPGELIEAGRVALLENEQISAMHHFEEAVILLDGLDLDKTKDLSQCLTNLLDIYISLEKPDRAIAALNDLTSIDVTLTSKPVIVHHYARIAALFSSAGMYDQAWELYWRALNHANDILPASDPLIQQLNDSYIELYKKSPSGKASREGVGLALLAKARSTPPKNLIQREPLINDSLQASTNANSKEDSGGEQGKQDSKPNEIMRQRAKDNRKETETRYLKSFRGSPTFSLIVTIILLVTLSGLSATIYNEKIHPVKALTAIDILNYQFESCDKHTSLRFLPTGECIRTKLGAPSTLKYSAVTSSLSDVLVVLRGSMLRQDVWYHCDQFGLKGSDRIRLYRDNAPELKIVQKMWWYANYAQKYYKESQLYPIDSDKCRRADPSFDYLNPESLKPDYASIILQKKTGEDMTASQPGARERHWRPFGIYCVCTNYKKFIVHGFDRFGLPLTSSDPNQYFVIKSRNGAAATISEITPQPTDLQSSDEPKPLHVFVTNNLELEDSVNWLKRFVPAVLLLSLSVALICSYHVTKRRQHSLLRFGSYFVSIALLLCLASWFAYVFDSNFDLSTTTVSKSGAISN